ncbi:hypothetical protein [Kitasatospora sp. NPDC088134]|uniref:hypothetical protein n=1 Tax=Kitasatospora sp. NPDC088134 TaxID=3364071 RepID=UPI00380761F4
MTVPEASGRIVRWVVGLALLLTVAGAGAWVGHWATAEGPPFGDSRACAGTDLPLDRALAETSLPFPAKAEDLHYLVRRNPDTGRLQVAISFRSDRATMTDYLIQRGLTAAAVADLADGPYVHSAALEYPGLCGDLEKPPTVDVPFPTVYSASASVSVETEGRSIREHTPVLLTIS